MPDNFKHLLYLPWSKALTRQRHHGGSTTKRALWLVLCFAVWLGLVLPAAVQAGTPSSSPTPKVKVTTPTQKKAQAQGKKAQAQGKNASPKPTASPAAKPPASATQDRYSPVPIRTYESTPYNLYIVDEARILTPSERETVVKAMITASKYGNMAFLSTDSVSDSAQNEAERFANRVFGSQPGSVFIIEMGSRELYLNNYGSLNQVVDVSASRNIVANVYKTASRGHFGDCASEAFIEVYKTAAGHGIDRTLQHATNALMAIALGLICCFAIVKTHNTADKVNPTNILSGLEHTHDFSFRRERITNVVKVYSPRSRRSSSRSSSSGGGGGFGGGSYSSGGGSSSGAGHRF